MLALDFRNWLGGEAVINTYCHQLAMDGGKRLAEVMGTKVMDETGELTLNMASPHIYLCTFTGGYDLACCDHIIDKCSPSSSRRGFYRPGIFLRNVRSYQYAIQREIIIRMEHVRSPLFPCWGLVVQVQCASLERGSSIGLCKVELTARLKLHLSSITRFLISNTSAEPSTQYAKKSMKRYCLGKAVSAQNSRLAFCAV